MWLQYTDSISDLYAIHTAISRTNYVSTISCADDWSHIRYICPVYTSDSLPIIQSYIVAHSITV